MTDTTHTTAQIKEQLLSGIEREGEMAEALIETMSRKQKQVISRDVSGLRETIGTEQALARKMSDLVTQRIELVRWAAQDLNLPEENLTLTHLASSLDNKGSTNWAEKVSWLRERLEKVQYLNRENQRLVAISMQLNREIFKALFPQAEVQPGTYSKSGKMDKGSKGKSLLNWQV